MNEKSVLIEYLYLDLQSCDRCIGTDAVIDEVLHYLAPVLEQAGYTIEYRKVEMKTAEITAEYRFLSSPTIRVNGKDICSSVLENSCDCCSDISGDDVDCRVFVYDGVPYEVPPKEMLMRDILAAIYSSQKSNKSHDYVISDNLHRFFSGKARKAACCCSVDCCKNE